MLMREEVVTAALYRAILGREPDEKGLVVHSQHFRESGLEDSVRAFIQSDEFRSRFYPGSHLNHAAPMQVETKLSAEELDGLWRHVAAVWTGLGEEEPYWSVLTCDEFRQRNMNNQEILDSFYASGESDLRLLRAYCARAGIEISHEAVVAEFGCGVGRVTRFLAREFSRVRAMDISLPHLQAAKTQLSKDALLNVDYVHLTNRVGLEALKNTDLFFSLIARRTRFVSVTATAT
jgi:hypothetical protein